MPLGCDCYSGCWGDHSQGWPEIPYSAAAWSRCVALLPYGSYVAMPAPRPSPASEEVWRRWTNQPADLGVIRIERESYAVQVTARLTALSALAGSSPAYPFARR